MHRKYRAHAIGIALSCLIVLSLLDITRFHPWVFHYFGILLLFSGLLKHTAHEQILDAARIIVGGIYFWSGIQKINPHFFTSVFPWFTQPFWENQPEFVFLALVSLGLFVPLIEICFAIGLFSRKFRLVSILGSTAMILLVLAALGPLGHNWNSSVWPWNIAIFLMVVVLFYKTTFTLPEFFTRLKKNYVAWGMVFIFWLLPVGNNFGLVDDYLAWSLYSGTVAEATLIGDQLILETLSPLAENNQLIFQQWSIESMNQAPYPEPRVFFSIFATVCTQFNDDPSLQLKITAPENTWQLERQTKTFTCQ